MQLIAFLDEARRSIQFAINLLHHGVPWIEKGPPALKYLIILVHAGPKDAIHIKFYDMGYIKCKLLWVGVN